MRVPFLLSAKLTNKFGTFQGLGQVLVNQALGRI